MRFGSEEEDLVEHRTPEPERSELKLVLCSVQSQYVDEVDDIFAKNEVADFVRLPRTHGRDQDGRHRGNKVFPGTLASFMAYVPTDRLDALLHDLRTFRDVREAHGHLRAAVLTPDQIL
jgi:hypothetical protein